MKQKPIEFIFQSLLVVISYQLLWFECTILLVVTPSRQFSSILEVKSMSFLVKIPGQSLALWLVKLYFVSLLFTGELIISYGEPVLALVNVPIEHLPTIGD